MSWQNRIVGTGSEVPDQLLANPFNWRIHPKFQQDVMGDVLSEIGWVQNVIVNQQTGHILDGHMRVAIAISAEESEVPVVYVDLSPEEEKLALATIDPIGALAVTDNELRDSLLEDLNNEESFNQLMDRLNGKDLLNEFDFSDDTYKSEDEEMPFDNAILQYVLVFDDVDQQSLWYKFLAQLKKQYSGVTHAQRLKEFLHNQEQSWIAE
tara:strand:+ start:1724 stop:2350 length:627 start_codon:yes stop_codon:yes gene_type:complete